MNRTKHPVFLTAEWRKLAVVNYDIDPALVKPYIPHQTELDLWHGACYVSLVGFMFCDTKLKGIKIPFHSTFEEVNLRFYVRFKDSALNEWKRGVVFIKEIVPKPALAFVANNIYKENYECMPMKHSWIKTNESLAVTYAWKRKEWNSMKIISAANALNIDENSEAEFITEHYWGYTKVNDTVTSEYEVEHPRWQVYPVKEASVEVDFSDVYGSSFQSLNNYPVRSIFLAEGSAIKVRSGRRLT